MIVDAATPRRGNYARGYAQAIANIIAQNDSSSVAGNSWANSCRMGFLVMIETPKSPWRRLQT